MIVNGGFLEKNPKLAEDFVRITQKAYAACVADFEPCLKALLDQVTGLDREEQLLQWGRIKYLMADEFTTTKGLGWIDDGRMQQRLRAGEDLSRHRKAVRGGKRVHAPGCSIPRSRWMRARWRSSASHIARHCEERSDEAIHTCFAADGLLRCARNDG